MPQPRRRLRYAIGLIFLLLVVVFLVYEIRHNAEFRSFDWNRFLAAFAGAHKSYLAVSVLAVYLTYVLRTWRWQCFSAPAKRLRFAPVLSATVVGFSAIMLLGRPGEIVRPALIARKEEAPLSAMMAVWAVERIFDTLTLMLSLAAVLLVAPGALLASTANPLAIEVARRAGLAATVVAVMGAVLLLLYRFHPEPLRPLFDRLRRFLPERWQARVDHTLRSFEGGLRFLRDPRALLSAVLLSLVLWLVICFAFWCICQSLGGDIAQLPTSAMIILIFFAMVGSAVQVPGVGGGLQATTFIALTGLYKIEVEVAVTAAILLWVISFCVVLVAGVPLLLYEGWSFTQLKGMTAAPEANSAPAETENAEAGVRTAP